MAETFADIYFPYSQAGHLSGRITRVCVRRREYQHEMLIVENAKVRGNKLKLRTNAPVTATVKGVNSRPISFVGYVHSVKETTEKNAAARRTYQITCVGPTYRMKEAKQRTWRDTRLDVIAAKLCREYRLNGVIEPHTSQKTFHQAGETDWEFLCRVARLYGYIVYSVGMTLYVHSRGYKAEAKHQQAHQFQYVELPDAPQTDVVEFRGTFSDAGHSHEGTTAKRALSGLDPVQGTPFNLSDDGKPTLITRDVGTAPSFTQYDRIVALDANEGRARLTGAQQRRRWAYQAEAKVMGRPDVAPSSVLYIDGMDNGYDGYWTVVGVDHVFADRYRYYMHVDLGTDSTGRTQVRPLPGSARAWIPRKTPVATLSSTGSSVRSDPLSFTWSAQAVSQPSDKPSVGTRRRNK